MVDIMAEDILPKTCPDFIARQKPRSTEKWLMCDAIRQVPLCVTLGMTLHLTKYQHLHFKNGILRLVNLQALRINKCKMPRRMFGLCEGLSRW